MMTVVNSIGILILELDLCIANAFRHDMYESSVHLNDH